MIYKEFRGEKLSALGFGSMRMPVVGGDYGKVDYKAAEEMVDEAMRGGVNYYDTAWGYHDGGVEPAIGTFLKQYPRKSFNLATKFPGYDLSNMGKVREIFNAQLEKCGVEYFDFYLMHNVCEMNIDAYLDEKYGTFEYLNEQRKEGRIRHLGFSAHGDLPVLRRFLEKYGAEMEFCQLQINWLDWTFQHAKEKVELLKSYNIPVWVMEPLRGGKLCSLAAEDGQALRALRPQESVTGWAFRFLQSVPEVVVTLSGMSSLEQVRENIKTFATDAPLTEAERAALAAIAKRMTEKESLPCTACRYCTGHCPKHLDIPELIKLYNEHRFTGGGFIAPMALSALPKEKWPSACVGCGSCAKVCPQRIDIPGMMKDFTKRLQQSE
mgnify:FL=1